MMSEMKLCDQRMLSIRLGHLSRIKPEYDNFRRIAIHNIQRDNERSLRSWWHRKYGIPPKPIDKYTFEELLVEYYEDFYFENPGKAEEFFGTVRADANDFTVPEHVQAMLGERKGETDLSRYQTKGDEELSDEQCQSIFDSIRGAKEIPDKPDSAEFDDTFSEKK